MKENNDNNEEEEINEGSKEKEEQNNIKEEENNIKENIKEEKNDIKEDENNIKENIKEEKKEDNNEENEFDPLIEVNTEFNENIYFNHFYLAHRELDFERKPMGDVIPYMMSRDFLYSYFEDKKNYKNSINETYPQILGRVKQFMNSNDDNFNKIFLDHITYYWDVLGKKNSETIIIPVLSKIVDDKIGTRIYFLKMLKDFLVFLEQIGNDGIIIIKTNILNIIEELYRNKINPEKNENKKKIIITEEEKMEYDNLLFERLTQICVILVKSKYKEELFKNILLLCDKNTNDINSEMIDKKNIFIFKKTMCIKLLTHLSSFFNEDFIKKNILPVLDNFFNEEENIQIKEEISMSLIILAQKLKVDFIGEYILNCLEKLSNDKHWFIRQKCIEILYKIIPELNKDENNNKIDDYIKNIISLIEKFIEDKNKKVRYYLIEKIGEIIKVCPKKDLPEKLIEFYIKEIEEYYSNEENYITDINEKQENIKKINFYFWYNFPAVLSYYGKEKWEQLKDIYKNIIKDKDINVISTVLSSFYEICNILGKEITLQELLPLYNTFLEEEQSTFVKDLAEKHLYKILSLLDKETRDEYFKKYDIGFNSILKEEEKNNFMINAYIQNKKISYLQNIFTFFKLYDNDTLYKEILSKCVYFSLDPIYKVRSTSCKLIADIVLYLYQKNYEKEKLIKLIGAYALNKKSTQRISFVKISKRLLLVDKTLYETILKRLLYIIATKEKNLNVLIALAKCLKKVITDKNSKCLYEKGIHYLCKKINNGKIMSISRIFRYVKILKVDTIEGIGNIYEENMFVQNNIFFAKEFNFHLREKNKSNNIINENLNENKFIN